ncbi:helix-turn-helix domain-containing protein [Nocardioides sp. MAH-18]|uniref:Helix-turn-helix domain-containing protein n=1 Tax=Nocardioides agri TaxID=2682843 RepID=A0A6L6XT88_9ACTN|nr:MULTISPECIES: helix-turn-helix domain-containing protein [unclassified Nocardioides]MBA2954832.1 helix-turn-helix domain-containing protein [Nocardioides sp. CGMCC 1.13656]MVQ49686.1 helix-turn-helix domain-containing protein [Nocardioides sp. MAH-18]
MPRVALVLHESPMLYEIAIAAEVLGVDRSELAPAGRWYDLVVCTRDGRPHPWLPDHPTATYAALLGADLVVVPSYDDLAGEPDPELVTELRAAHAGGSRVAALCTGAFVLAAAGLLDGRAATTHWMHAEELARRYPRVDVRADVLYVDEGDVLTSAGKTAALDLCLHLVRTDLGASAANGLARRLVVPAHRRGGQAQFIDAPAAPRSPDGLGPTLDWARGRLDQPLTVADLARHASLSTRQLARRMRAELQSGPLDWLHQQRIVRARELLERTDASVDQVAASCGLGTAATLRRHFHRATGVTPTAYRSMFRGPVS